MEASFGHSALSVFDVWPDARDFLADALDSKTAPEDERRRLFDLSLFAGARAWYSALDCAESIRCRYPHDPTSIEGSDTLAHLEFILPETPPTDPSSQEPWHETDRLIALAKTLGTQPRALPSALSRHSSSARRRRGRRRVKKPSKSEQRSHYWLEDGHTPQLCPEPPHPYGLRYPEASNPRRKISPNFARAQSSQPVQSNALAGNPVPGPRSTGGLSRDTASDYRHTRATTSQRCHILSPYFAAPARERAKRPLAGKVSCVPFPPLAAPAFGLVQERLAHEPFWLLIAVTFLIKTSGQLAIPAFDRVRERFPTPLHLANPANADELAHIIRHLGLAVVRVGYIQKYARAFLDNPPRPGVRYRVRNYDRRDVGRRSESTEEPPQWYSTGYLTPDACDDDTEAWEIGHMTQGKYAIDSWRIFCRDEMLGRAEDWNGKGREPEFQPEWMRVMPQDKELRALLRWMWMRDGWEWDPVTGERTVLDDNLRSAVDEGRVEYDETGGLRIVEEPRGG